MSDTEEEDEEEWSKPQSLSTDVPETTECIREKRTMRPVEEKGCKGEHSRVIIHIDIDCFYAQVEMIRDPSLKDKPLGIQQKYLLVTCNYVARKLGVKKMSGVKEAKQVCPQIIIKNGEDLTHYREMSYRITETIHKYSRLVERLGFDENFVDVTELVNTYPWSEKFSQPPPQFVYGDPTEVCECGCHSRLVIGSHIAADIRRTLFEELGITSCAGIAHNKVLAKMVGEVHKPNQQTLMFPCHTDEVLTNRNVVKKISGIGYSMCKKLGEIGVETIQELRDLPITVLENTIGANNAHMIRDLCFGIDSSPVVPTGPPQSMSDEDSFKNCTDVEDAKRRFCGLLGSLIKRLEGDGRIPQTFRLSLRKLSAENKWTNRESRQCPIPSHVFSRFYTSEDKESCQGALLQMALELFKKMVDVKQPFHLTLLNVCFTKLQEQHKPSATASITAFLQKRRSPGNVSQASAVPCTSNTNEAGSSPVRVKKKSSIDSFFAKVSPTKVLPADKHASLEFSGENNSTSKKRSFDGHNTGGGKNISKRQKVESSKVLLSEETIDQDVFSQLPPEIQREILEERNTACDRNMNLESEFDDPEKGVKSTKDKDCFPECETSTGRSSVKNNTLNKGDCDAQHPQVMKDMILPPDGAGAAHQFTDGLVSRDSNSSKIPTEERQGVNKKLVSTDGRNQFEISAEASSAMKKFSNDIPDGNDRKTTQGKCDWVTEASSSNRDPPDKSDTGIVPPDIDPKVFRELPHEIQEELVKNWKNKQEFSFSPMNRSKSTQPKKQTLYKYFKKK